GGGAERTRGGPVVMLIDLTELAGRHLADEPGAAPRSGDATARVTGRRAADLVRGAHVRIEPLRLLGVDQPHRSLDQPLRRQEIVAGVGDHVDDGIADAQDIEARVGHSVLRGKCEEARRLAARWVTRNIASAARARHRQPMRRYLALSIALFAAACAPRPQATTTPVPTPQPPPPPVRQSALYGSN